MSSRAKPAPPATQDGISVDFALLAVSEGHAQTCPTSGDSYPATGHEANFCVKVGGSLSFGSGAVKVHKSDNTLGAEISDYTLTSSFTGEPADTINNADHTVTFNHASPHTITVHSDAYTKDVKVWVLPASEPIPAMCKVPGKEHLLASDPNCKADTPAPVTCPAGRHLAADRVTCIADAENSGDQNSQSGASSDTASTEMAATGVNTLNLGLLLLVLLACGVLAAQKRRFARMSAF